MSVFLFNVGLDLSVWVWTGMAVVCSFGFLVFALQAIKLWKVVSSGADGSTYQFRKAFTKAIWRSGISLVFACLMTLFMFGAYGAGQPTQVETGRGEAIHEGAPKEPTKDQLKKDSEKKRDPELKKQEQYHKRVDDPSDKKYENDADEYERRMLDRDRR